MSSPPKICTDRRCMCGGVPPLKVEVVCDRCSAGFVVHEGGRLICPTCGQRDRTYVVRRELPGGFWLAADIAEEKRIARQLTARGGMTLGRRLRRIISGCVYCKTGLLENGRCDTCGRWDSAP